MKRDKKLIVNYILLFLFIVSLILWGLVQYKNNEIKFFLKNDLNHVEKTYKSYLKRSENFSEIVFYNHISQNNKIISLLKKNISKEKKAQELYLLLKNKLNTFKKYDLQEINFYLPSSKTLLKSEYKGYKVNEKEFTLEYIQKSIKELQPIITVAVNSTSASIKYIRPLFDKNFKLISVVEITTNMPRLAFTINKNSDFNSFFIFKKELLKKNLDSAFLNNYKEFIFDDKYLYEDSIYNKTILNKLTDKDIEIIQKNILQNKKFALNYQTKNRYSMISFFPLKNSVTGQSIGFIVALGNNKTYNSLLKKYDLYIVIAVFISALFTLMLYFIHYYRYKFDVIDYKFRDLYKSIDRYVIVAETDKRGIVTYVSEAFCRVSGYKKSEIIGRPINMLRSPDISKKFFDSMWKTISNGEVWEGEIKNIDKNGNSYWVKGNITPILNNKKKIVGYRSIRVNISDEKQLQKVNEILKRDLLIKLNEIKTRDNSKIDESKIKLMGEILDAFSNEWKKPISNISLSLIDFENKLLNKKIDKKEQMNYISKLNKEINILSKQLNDFKSLFYNDNSHDRYSVYNVISHTIASIFEENVTINLTGNRLMETYGISFDLRKVILGIIYNSIEQLKLKKISDGMIHIDISQEGDFVLIKCQDNAQGIPEEIIDKIFEPDFSTKDDISRSGITLHMARLLIKKSDGQLWVKNENDGCCFYIKLITKDRRKGERI